MARLCVRAYGVSLDGFAAGPDQSLQQPLGVRGPELMAWAFLTRTFHAMPPGSCIAGRAAARPTPSTTA